MKASEWVDDNCRFAESGRFFDYDFTYEDKGDLKTLLDKYILPFPCEVQNLPPRLKQTLMAAASRQTEALGIQDSLFIRNTQLSQGGFTYYFDVQEAPSGGIGREAPKKQYPPE